ncbi:MAG TPA: sterol desaturase family protein [Rhizomicrobium sp.]|jgi:sterol desaturase/sphingolipid hydroxylase (fatty acid hydroxylase superfamily)|nr:sterol desaturase family protein [Rhizomicrobium sp.]
MDAAGRANGQGRQGRTWLADSPRLFHNPVLDRLSRVHRLVPLLLYAPILVLLLSVALWRLPFPTVAAGVFGGYILWTLVEYFGHRFLFHYRSRTAAGTRIQFLIHGVHHDHPNDPLRLVMPPLMSIPIMAAAYGVLRAGCGAEASLPAWAGFMGGYLFYDMLHYHVHHGRPRTALGRLLRHRHMHHHFRDDTCSFGVSAPWWDEVFGTSPPARN